MIGKFSNCSGSRNPHVSTSCAIVCRARNELPFLKAWIQYHLELGVERIYLIDTDDNSDRVSTLLESWVKQGRVRFCRYYEFSLRWSERCQNAIFPEVAEDWVLVLDLDEYLVLNAFDSLSDFVNSLDSDVAQV